MVISLPSSHHTGQLARQPIGINSRPAPLCTRASADASSAAIAAAPTPPGFRQDSGQVSMSSYASADEPPEPPQHDDARVQPVNAGTVAQLFPTWAAPTQEPSHLSERVEPALVVFSGGTAFNSVAGHVRQLTTRVTHVLPVSDDGGSTAEIVRVLGGPAVGDIRSRCLRLADDSDPEARAVRGLLAYRLPGHCAADAKREWYDIVEGDHPLWEGVSEPYKHTIRAFLVHFHANILRHSTERFNFKSGSVGNFFFAGARTFFRSLEAAIFLFSRVARIPEGSLVLPSVCTEERLSLAAELTDGTVLAGQNQISHPCCPLTAGSPVEVDKSRWEPLPASIKRVFYLSAEGDGREHEVAPAPNPRVLTEIERSDAIVYGMGSLFTSVCPSLVLRGVGEAVAARRCPKILVLNGGVDRETSACQAHTGPMAATDVVLAITDALNRSGAKRGKADQLLNAPKEYVTAVLVPEGGPMEVDEAGLRSLGVEGLVRVPTWCDGDAVLYDPDALVAAIGRVVAEKAANGGDI